MLWRRNAPTSGGVEAKVMSRRSKVAIAVLVILVVASLSATRFALPGVRAGGARSLPRATAGATGNCGPWRVISSPNLPGGPTGLGQVVAFSSSDVWTLGSHTDSSSGHSSPLALHWNGASWLSRSTGLQDNLVGVGGIGGNDVWAVGSYFSVAAAANQTRAEHWNGTSWSVVPTPNDTNRTTQLSSVAGVATNDVWAVGITEFNSLNYFPLIEHWNGTSWSIVSGIPDPPVGQAYLNGVTAIATNDVWAVGGTGNSNLDPMLIEHWDGTAWTTIPNTPNGLLYSVSAGSANDVWAVGESAGDTTLTMHWNGTAWSPVPSPTPPNAFALLSSVAATPSGPAFAVGGAGSSPIIEKWNGSSWAFLPNPSVATSTFGLGGIAATSPWDVWVAGSATFGSNPATTLTAHLSRPMGIACFLPG
jgi:hypothetical protein